MPPGMTTPWALISLRLKAVGRVWRWWELSGSAMMAAGQPTKRETGT